MKDVDEILMRLIAKNKTPSVRYAIFTRDHIIYEFNNGFANIEDHTKVCEDTTYHLFSITKTFTALAIMQLCQNGQLNLEDPVHRYVNNLPYPHNISVRQLLTHSAGIPNPNPLSWIHLADEHNEFNSSKFFLAVFEKYKKVKFQPNDKFSYSNLGYVILGRIIEEIYGHSYESYIQKNILNPVGIMNQELGFNIPDNGKLSRGYQKRISLMNLLLGLFIDKSKFMDKAEGKWKPFKNYYVNGSAYGGLIGSGVGLRKYVQELLKPNCLLISDEFKEKIFQENYLNSRRPTGMCLSWFKGTISGREYFAHAGGGGGYYCEVRIYPEHNTGSVIIFNRSGMKDERILDELDTFYFENEQ